MERKETKTQQNPHTFGQHMFKVSLTVSIFFSQIFFSKLLEVTPISDQLKGFREREKTYGMNYFK